MGYTGKDECDTPYFFILFAGIVIEGPFSYMWAIVTYAVYHPYM